MQKAEQQISIQKEDSASQKSPTLNVCEKSHASEIKSGKSTSLSFGDHSPSNLMKNRDTFSRAHSGSFMPIERDQVQPVASNEEFKRIRTQHKLTSGKDMSLFTFT